MVKVLILINTLFLILCSNLSLKDEVTETQNIEINIRDFADYNSEVGKKGTLVFEEGSHNNEVDIIDTGKKTYFEITISEKYKTSCGIWRQENRNFLVFCNIDESIPEGKYTIILDGISFKYKEYIITLKASQLFTFKKLNKNIIDLYSDKQTIILKEDKEIYDLKFQIVSYNNETLIINNQYVLENCKQVNNELICPITKSKLEEILTPSVDESKIYLYYLNDNSTKRLDRFNLIPIIEVKSMIPKKDIYIGITKLVENVAEHDTLIAYKTNVTDISTVRTDLESFCLKFENRDGEEEFSCSFRKYENTALLLVCWAEDGVFWLKEIKEEIILNDINIKYNFRIQPVNNIKKIITDRREKGSFIFYLYPEVLDFTKEDILTVDYHIENPDSLTGITLNEDAEDLTCEALSREIKRCKVPISHFNGKESGYYFTKHSNHLDGKSFSYEAPPIKIILPE